MKKRITALMLAICVVLGTIALAAGGDKAINVTPMALNINGQAVTPTKSDGTPAEVFAYDGATYVPLRYLSELLGIEVQWDKNDPNTAKLVSDKLTVGGGDGVYTGTGSGFNGEITATVTVSGGKITACTLTGPGETPAIGGAALPKLEEQVVAAGSADIDGVTGATMTSGGVKDAVKAALAASKGETVNAKLTPGTYTATKEGYQHCINTVSVTVDESRILSVEIIESTDHPRTVAGIPCDLLPGEIVAKQTYNVDSITGATVTSNAIKMAVKDCLDQAGGSVSFSAPIEKPELVVGKDAETDVLVIGGGGSGFMAAVEAYTGTGADDTSSLKVMIVEKAAMLGGSTGLSGGLRYFYKDGNGNYDKTWLDSVFVKEKAVLEDNNTLPVFEDLLRNELRIMPQVNNLITALGVPGDVGDSLNGTWPFMPPAGTEKPERWKGANLTLFMNSYLPTTDVDVRLNTAATKLLTNNQGEVIGASVQDKTSTYNIYAKKVILACGGFPHNKEMIEQYAPEYANTLIFAAGGNTGDGIKMATEIGAVTVGNAMLGYLGSDDQEGLSPDYAAYCYGGNVAMDINIEGERFTNESLSPNKRYYAVLQQPEATAWGIADSNNPDAKVLIDSKSQYVFHADTLEELAKLINVPADKLVKTTNAYNAAFDAGKDVAFGTPIEKMNRIDAAPYYACLLRPVALSSLVGLSVDSECRVLNAQGKVISNLYAAGDLVIGGNKLSFYYGGRGVGTAIYTGSLAGVTAKTDLLGK